jgi:tetratricopeptide (TPR) repeat protein
MGANMNTRFAVRAIALAVSTAIATSPLTAAAWGSRTDVDEEATRFAETKPATLRPFYRQLYRDGEWNAVLNYQQLALATMETGDFDAARRSLDEAISRIEQIYANDENARRALSVFNAEKVKDFKGEPYERAMTYFYRAVLYSRDGDYENARAAFLAADLQDTMAEQETYAGDFGMMKYLAGWASSCAGDDARAKVLIQEAKQADTSIADLSDAPGAAIVLIDSGAGPSKRASGKHKELLVFERGAGPDDAVYVKASSQGEMRDLKTAGDVYFQASTRGGRQVDGVLAGKAQFKDTANTVGNVATGVGQAAMMQGIYSNRNNLAGAGAIIGLVGLFAKGVSSATTPTADTRAWQSLPSVVLFHDRAEPLTGTVSVVSSNGERPLAIQPSSGKCSIAWGRTRSSLGVAEGGSVRFVDERIQDDTRRDKNQLFRQQLQADAGNVGLAKSEGAQ